MTIPTSSPLERDRYLDHLHAVIAITEKYQPIRVLFDESRSATAVDWEFSGRGEQYGEEVEAYFTQHHLDSQREIERLIAVATQRAEELLQRLHTTVGRWYGVSETTGTREELLHAILSQTKEHALIRKTRDSLASILEQQIFP